MSRVGSLEFAQVWVYFYDNSQNYTGGQRITVPTTNITQFPLFTIISSPPPPAPVWSQATSLWSEERQDQAYCLSTQCYQADAPGNPGDYVTQFNDSYSVSSGGSSVVIGGKTYALTPLTLYFSNTFNDNLVTTNSTPPDPSYTFSTFNDGYVLATQAPNSVPLQLYYKKYSTSHQDYATVASATAVSYYQSQNYSYIFSMGYVLLSKPDVVLGA
jgi:hypothetical protein